MSGEESTPQPQTETGASGGSNPETSAAPREKVIPHGEVSTAKNHRGIPAAHFIDNVQQFCDRNNGPQTLLQELRTLYGKYKFMESELTDQKQNFLNKIPDIEAGLKSLEFLKQKQEEEEPVEFRFELADNLIAKAQVPETKTVLLWLGVGFPLLSLSSYRATSLCIFNLPLDSLFLRFSVWFLSPLSISIDIPSFCCD